MVSRWALDQFSNTVWTLQWRCLTGWRFAMLCAHQHPYTGCAHRHFLHHRKQTHFWESNLRHLRLAGVPVEMLTLYTNPPQLWQWETQWWDLPANSWGTKSILAHSIEFTCGSPIEIELMLPVEGYNHPGYCVQVWAISVARSQSYAPLNYKPEAHARTRSTNYARDASMWIM